MDDPRTRDGREGNLRDRLQPALLDRLTDDAPQRAAEAHGAQWIGTERLRAAVLRDLAWLLNTRNAEDGFVDWSAFAHAQASVLNYGMRPLVGKPMSGVERMSVEASIRDAILRFEPRIAPGSIDVRSVIDAPGGRAGERRHNVLLFEIRGTLWSIPHPLEFVLRSDLDLETGAMSLQSVAGADAMDTRLLDYYNRELAYLRELGGEFAQQFPKVAARLRLNESGPPDPYVERLLEGFSFLTARVQLKMDAEFPRFTQALLDAVYPGYIAPLPSMAIVRFAPLLNEGSLAQGWHLPAGTALRARPVASEQTACEFRTAHDLTLWPLELTDATVTGAPSWLPRGAVAARQDVRGALRIRLKARGGARLSQLPLDRLTFHLAGPERDALHLLELIAAHALGVVCHDPGQPPRWLHTLDADAIVHEGFDPAQAILPDDGRSFHGYRLLREYFAFPARFLFFSIGGLRAALARATGDECELTVLFDRHDAALEAAVDARHLALNCTPAVNLFARRADRIPLQPGAREHHVVVDRSRPLDYEIYAVQRLASEQRDDGQSREFRPFHASFAGDDGNYGAYYTVRREPRLVSAQARANGTRTGYVGSETYVSIVDSQCTPYDETMRYLAADTLCTNRDLVLLQPPGDANTFTLRVSAPVERVVAIRGPSRPRPPIADAQTAWRLIRHLGLARHTLTDLDDDEGAHALRELLGLHADPADAAMRRQIDGVQRVAFSPVFRRLPALGPLMFGRGVQVDVTVDDHAFSGDSPFLLGAVLEQFFARHVSINAFAECVLTSTQRGTLARWPARIGRRPAI